MLKEITTTEINKAWSLINKATRIGIISHRGPDADSIGANLSLKLALEPLGKQVTSLCIDPIPENCKFMPQSSHYKSEFNYRDYDLYIMVDCGEHYMSMYHEAKPEILSNEIPIINIDHHASNDDFGAVNLVERTAASTTFIVWNLFKIWDIQLTPYIATCLMAGLFFDTGSFQHDNTTKDVLICAGELTRQKADIQIISYYLFQKTTINKLKLWGRVLARAKVNQKNIVSSVITEKDFIETGANKKDTEGLIDYLTAVKNSRFAILLSEDFRGGIKGSLRTQGETDVSQVANLFGGGGHKKASGFRIPGKLSENVQWLVK